MIKNRKKRKCLVFIFILFLFFFGIKNVLGATTLKSYNFNGTAAPIGGRFLTMDYLEGRAANYVKVTIKANSGDKYDLRLVYTSTFPSERKTLAAKNGITAKGSNNTFYFIPKNGSCPGTSSQCIKVPSVSQISNNNNTVLYYDVLYGIEIYNGSWLGGTLKVSGSYSFINY